MTSGRRLRRPGSGAGGGGPPSPPDRGGGEEGAGNDARAGGRSAARCGVRSPRTSPGAGGGPLGSPPAGAGGAAGAGPGGGMAAAAVASAIAGPAGAAEVGATAPARGRGAAPLGGQDRGAQGDAVLGVGVHRHRAAEGRAHQLGHQRGAGRAADQQDRRDVVGGDARRAQGPVRGRDRVGQGRPHHLLVLGPGQAHLGLQVGQQHRDRHVGVRRQRLLGLDALLAEPGHRGGRRRVGRVELVDGAVDRLRPRGGTPRRRSRPRPGARCPRASPASPTPRRSCAGPRRRTCPRPGRRRR